MAWINSLEARFGHLAIPGITRVIVLFNALVFLLSQLNPEYIPMLHLLPQKVMEGEVWRLFTYIFIPPSTNLLFLFIALSFLWFLGEGLEQEWGAFKLNLFYLCGMIGCTIAAFFFGGSTTGALLNLSLLFAFATIYPDEIIYFFFIIPIKIKWLAIISFIVEMLIFIPSGLNTKMAIIASFTNYLIFFGPMIVQIIRHRKNITARRREYKNKSIPETIPLHSCAVCHKTEITNPELNFRVSKDGNDYCEEHLRRI